MDELVLVLLFLMGFLEIFRTLKGEISFYVSRGFAMKEPGECCHFFLVSAEVNSLPEAMNLWTSAVEFGT